MNTCLSSDSSFASLYGVSYTQFFLSKVDLVIASRNTNIRFLILVSFDFKWLPESRFASNDW